MAKRKNNYFDLPKSKVNRESLDAGRFLLKYLRPYRGKFAISLGALLLSSLAGLAFPGFTGMLIDAAMNPGPGLLNDLGALTLILLGVLALQSIFSFVRTYFIAEVSERSLADLRRDLYSKVVCLPMSFFHQNRVGELTSRINNDIGMIQQTLTVTVTELIRQMIILTGGIALVAYTSPELTVVILLCVPVVVALAVIFGRAIRKASTRVQDLYAELTTVIEETFQGITVVKAFTAEERETGRIRSKLDEIIGTSLGVARARGAFIALVLFILFGGIVGVIWYGGRMVQTGALGRIGGAS